ncbi:MAG: surface carbohydrate biosynthesis protein [Vicinamibacterales bacterium]
MSRLPPASTARVALVVDNPYRDLPGVILLACELARRGHTCLLAPSNLEWRELGALVPEVAVLTNIRGPRHELARRLLDAGCQVAVLESEGGVMPNFDTYTTMAAPDPALFHRVSRFCTWGPRVAHFLVESGWYDQHQVTVTGSPRFDFYAPQWREVARRASADLDNHVAGPLILVNGSFPRANPRFLTPEREVQSWQALGFSREHIERFQRIEHEAMLAMAEVANHLARQFPHATVVYRPHPFERLDTYNSLLDRRDNLRLLKVGTVEGWILRASVVVHRNSTTAIEAAMCGVPALLPLWLPTAETLEACDAVSVPCADVDVLDARVTEALAGAWSPDDALRAATNRVLSDWFHIIDGRAHERAADALAALLERRHTLSRRAFRDIHYWGWRPATLSRRSRGATVIRRALGVPVSWSVGRWSHVDPAATWAASEKFYDADAVRRLVTLIRPVDGIRVRQASPDTDYGLPYAFGRTVVVESVDA